MILTSRSLLCFQDMESTFIPVTALAALDSSSVLSPLLILRSLPGDKDITIKILYCGITRMDVEAIKNIYGDTKYPFVAGNEIIGEVSAVGKKVTKFKVGDNVGVGRFSNSCQSCYLCRQGLENVCRERILTYGYSNKMLLHGGFSNIVVVNENFVVKIPDTLQLEAAAPLLGAGVSIYSTYKNCVPVFHKEVPPNELHIGVCGLGTLGCFGIMFGKALGFRITAISSSISKKDYAMKLGADHFVVVNNGDEMKAVAETMDVIVDTIPLVHSLEPLQNLLKENGLIVIMSKYLTQIKSANPHGRCKLMLGVVDVGMKETRDMINFAALHKFNGKVEVIGVDQVNNVIETIGKGLAYHRLVIDMNTMPSVESETLVEEILEQEGTDVVEKYVTDSKKEKEMLKAFNFPIATRLLDETIKNAEDTLLSYVTSMKRKRAAHENISGSMRSSIQVKKRKT